jgi:short-subunit dehydrogenase
VRCCWSRRPQDLESAAASIREASGRRVEICATTCARRRAAQRSAARSTMRSAGPDILVNNAGVTQSGDFFKRDDATSEDGFALKFYSR